MLCWFLPYNKWVSRKYPSVPSLLKLPSTPTPSHCSRSSQSTWQVPILKTDYVLFIHASIEVHLHSFYFLATLNAAVWNVHVQVFVWTYIFISLRSRAPGSYGNSVFNHLKNYLVFFPRVAAISLREIYRSRESVLRILLSWPLLV